MKLLTQTGLFMIGLSMVLVMLFAATFYFTLQKLSNDSLDQQLEQERMEVLRKPEILIIGNMADVPYLNRIRIETRDSINPQDILRYDSLIRDPDSRRIRRVRCIQFYEQILDANYEFTIIKSKISSEDLVKRISLLLSAMVLLFLVGNFVLNRYVFRKTWQSFYDSLFKVQRFKAEDSKPEFQKSSIQEFKLLNEELSRMTERISNDYHDLQAFTSHTTHEIQTPLAVIRSKIELLLQTKGLTSEQMNLIKTIYSQAGQLSRLNHALSLLLKIDNQFVDNEAVSLRDLLEKHHDFLEEQADIRKLNLKLELLANPIMMINPTLADILFLNIVRNALFHNVPDGWLTIRVEPHQWSVSNSGPPPKKDPSDFFKEFTRGEKSDGLGLGLSIVNKIIRKYQWHINYIYESDYHKITINLEPNSKRKK